MNLTRSILIVEDSEDQRTALVNLFEARGYAVRAAASVTEALALLKTAPPPRGILLDWVLPDRPASVFLAHLRANPDLAAIPVAVLSGFPERAERASLLSGITFLAKPVAEELLLSTMDSLLKQPFPEILLVEDDPAVGEALAFGLRHQGFALRSTTSGAQAIEIFRRQRETIDLILLDVLMPGMDGVQTMNALRQIDANARVVFMSGNIGAYSEMDLRDLGALLVLQKPFSVNAALAASLRELAGK